MISTLGNVLQVLTMLVALVAAASLAVGVKTRREGAVNAGYLLVFGNAVALTACVAIILLCFLTRNFSLAYVASNFPQTDSPLLPLYQVAGVWAGRQGSLLFWTWLISVFSAMVAWRRMHVTDDLSSVALAVSEVVVALFCATLVFSESNNPFIATAAQYLNEDGTLVSSAGGMNPLLLHWAMVLHPPATFIGYAGCTIPFAYAMAALITGDVSARWVELSDRVAIFSFIFLTIGMALGAVWAYVVLGWGGFWAWDAVENASLFSWLSAVAMIHSFTMYRKRGCFKRWSMFAAVITFIFVVLGTFITRSGLVQSVHAFAEDPVSTYFFLAIMVLAALSFLVLLVYRHGTLDDAEEIESLASKGGSYYLTNLVCIVGAVLVAYLTVSSSLPTWMPLGGQVVSAGVYNAVARPATALFGLLMAVCPMLGWRRTDGAAFARNMRVPAVLGASLFVVPHGLLCDGAGPRIRRGDRGGRGSRRHPCRAGAALVLLRAHGGVVSCRGAAACLVRVPAGPRRARPHALQGGESGAGGREPLPSLSGAGGRIPRPSWLRDRAGGPGRVGDVCAGAHHHPVAGRERGRLCLRVRVGGRLPAYPHGRGRLFR